MGNASVHKINQLIEFRRRLTLSIAINQYPTLSIMLSITLYPLVVLVVLLAIISSASSFITTSCNIQQFASHAPYATTSLWGSSTVIPGTDEKQKQDEDKSIIPPGEGETRGPIEWLIDDRMVSREFDDPYHILLLDETFVHNDRITIDYVASSCAYVLSMPYDEAAELASHAEQEGFSCLGTWGHEECLRLGKQLQQRDIVCRVVPFCEGGDRAWQARNADSEMKSANDDTGWD